MTILDNFLFQFSVEAIIFIVLLKLGKYIFKKIKNSSHHALNPQEYLPPEELQTIRQVYYLIILSLLFIDFVYTFSFDYITLLYASLFDILISLYVAIRYDTEKWKNKIIAFFLIPMASFSVLLFDYSYLTLLYIIHAPILLYFMYLYYRKFREYTESNGLGFTIILLFSIVFISLICTIHFENKNPLDALVMVSNAFTSNGYTVLGNSIIGKIDSLFLVWGGYIISGASTATLTSIILYKYFNKRLKKLESLINEEENNND